MSRVRRSLAGCVGSLSALLGAGVAWADDVPLLADNIVPIEVRQFKPGFSFNTVYVDVTVCGSASSCRTVPNVLVDTGSTGLMLNREVLDGLELDAVTASDGRPLSHWASFVSQSIWATMHKARVRIGNITTEAIPIALYDKPSPSDRLPAAYLKEDARDWLDRAANGILGISPQRHVDEGYFVDRRWGGAQAKPAWHSVSVDQSRQLTNPIAHFPAPYNNGSVIKLFSVEPGGAYATLPGWLGLGVGLPTYGLFPAAARVISHELDEAGHFPMKIAGRRFDVLIDSGTNMLALDLAHLEHPGIHYRGDADWRYDAPTVTPIELAALCGQREVKLAQPLHVGPAQALFWGKLGIAVVPALAITSRQAAGDTTLGSPFFYGRTVATGLRGTVNPFRQPAPAPGLHGDVACDEALDPHSPSPHGYVAYTDDPRSGERPD